jgi:hypothetical protein
LAETEVAVENDLNRRDFARLTLAALAGLTAGAPAMSAYDPRRNENPLLSDPHVCRGLNTCRGKGADHRNRCAGTGVCATARYHPCKMHNDCRGQGGCGDSPGENQCRGWGACDVPLKPRLWVKARRRFEELMKQRRRQFGVPPEVAQQGQQG